MWLQGDTISLSFRSRINKNLRTQQIIRIILFHLWRHCLRNTRYEVPAAVTLQTVVFLVVTQFSVVTSIVKKEA